MSRRRLPLAIALGLLAAVAAFVLVAPLGCESLLEVIDTGPGTSLTGPGQAGPVRCTRILLPDYEGSGAPARWPAYAGAIALGLLIGSAVLGREETGTPPPGEAAPDDS